IVFMRIGWVCGPRLTGKLTHAPSKPRSCSASKRVAACRSSRFIRQTLLWKTFMGPLAITVFVVPGVPDDTAPGGRLSRGYRGRRRRGYAREDRDRVPDRFSPLRKHAQV